MKKASPDWHRLTGANDDIFRVIYLRSTILREDEKFGDSRR